MSERYDRYIAYIRSEAWERRKAAYYAIHARECAYCKQGPAGVQLHHRTYVRLGDEWDSDFIPLCDHCHGLVHTMAKQNGESIDFATRALLPQTVKVPSWQAPPGYRGKKKRKPKRAPRPHELSRKDRRKLDLAGLNRRRSR